MASKRKCVICGTRYEYCNNCPADDGKPRWMFLFDEKNCNDIWEEFNAYRTGAKNATQTKKALEALDLSKENEFAQVWKDLLQKIREEAEPDQEVEVSNEPQKKDNFKKKRY